MATLERVSALFLRSREMLLFCPWSARLRNLTATRTAIVFRGGVADKSPCERRRSLSSVGPCYITTAKINQHPIPDENYSVSLKNIFPAFSKETRNVARTTKTEPLGSIINSWTCFIPIYKRCKRQKGKTKKKWRKTDKRITGTFCTTTSPVFASISSAQIR